MAGSRLSPRATAAARKRCDRRFERGGAEMVLVDSSGPVTEISSEQIDAQAEFHEARTWQEAAAAERKIRGLEVRTRTTIRSHIQRRIGVVRRRTSGARHRPGVRRRIARSAHGPPPGSDSEGEGEPGRARLELTGARR